MESITISDILLLPAILIFFGVFVYGVAFGNGVRLYELPKYRWAGIALLGLAAIVGVRYVWLMFEPGNGPFYRALLQTRKVVAAHYVSLVLPLLLVGAIVGLEMWFKRYRREML